MTTIDHHPNLSPMTADVLRWVTHDWYIDRNNLIRGPVGRYRHELVEPEASTQPFIVPTLSILHSNAGPNRTFWENLIRYWRRNDINGEAHLQIHGVSDSHATVVQGIPFNRRADCNYKANRFLRRDGLYGGAISFETQDNGAALLPVTPWSSNHNTWSGQVEVMISTLTCLCVTYGMWCTMPAGPYDSGIGHHILYKEWSAYTGKTCPGAARIRQMDYIRTEVAKMLVEFSAHTGWKCGQVGIR